MVHGLFLIVLLGPVCFAALGGLQYAADDRCCDLGCHGSLRPSRDESYAAKSLGNLGAIVIQIAVHS
jgi:hypothetical protein